MGSKTSCFLLCKDCGGKLTDEKAVESSIRHSQLISLRANSEDPSSRDHEIEEIQANYVHESKTIEKPQLKANESSHSLAGSQGPAHVYLTLKELIAQSLSLIHI